MPHFVEDDKTIRNHSGFLLPIFIFRNLVCFLALFSLWISGMVMSPRLTAQTSGASNLAPDGTGHRSPGISPQRYLHSSTKAADTVIAGA